MTARYLLTGGAGFIGSALTQALLERGDEVTILDNGQAAGFDYVTDSGARIVASDIADIDTLAAALDGCTAVVHLAAQTSVLDSISRPEDDFTLNVVSSVRLLDAMRRLGPRRIVFASSNAAISGNHPPAREDLPMLPRSPYGAAKASVEAYLAAYHATYDIEGVALRFSNAYGPRSAHKSSVVASFITAYLAGGPLVIRGDGTQTRDFVHVSDVVQAIVACLDAPAEIIGGEIFQVGTGTETSLNELAELLFAVGGHAVPVDHAAAAPGDVARNYSSVDKAAGQLGYQVRMSLSDGLADTLDWFREH